jgi:hypothetical protein
MSDREVYTPDIMRNFVYYVVFGVLILIVPLIQVYKAITAE